MNECKGCLSYSEDLRSGCSIDSIPHISETEQCPCITCLVKGMCEDSCEDLRLYHGLIDLKMGRINISSECKGCSAFQKGRCVNGCDSYISETERCPCLNCLIKIMCNKVCERFMHYVKLTYTIRESQ